MTKRNLMRFLASAAFCLFVIIGQTFAQSTVTGGVRGKVTDPQGAIVPNATVTATNVDTNKVETGETDSDGGFRFSNLQPGTYTISINASGFGAFTQEKVVVEVGQVTTVDVPLSVAGQTTSVEVTADAPVINTNDNSNSTNINQTSINELPINGRRASNFVLLTPGVAPDGAFGLISFRGISGLLNNSTVDGGDNNQAFFSEERGRTRISYSISQDAVREFQVNTSNYSAEFGRAAGGVVNTVTKSGTNDFHGSAFYYLRDNRFGARNAFSFDNVLTPTGVQRVALKPKDRRHQFGGSLGGPLPFLNFGEGGPVTLGGKDRLFFFFSYDQQKRDFPGVAAPSLASFFVLTPAQQTTLTTRGVTPAQRDAGITFLRNLNGVVPRTADQTLFLPKIDWVINEKNTFSAVYNRLRADSPAGVQSQAVVNRGIASFGDDKVTLDTLNLRLNSTISPSFINEVRFQYSRDLEQQIAQPAAPGEPITALGSSPSVSITNGFTFGKPNFLDRVAYPDERRTQIADTVTLIQGKHTIKFGGDFNYVSDLLDNLFQNAGAYSYASIVDFISDLAFPATGGCFVTGSTTVRTKCYTSFNQGFGPTAFKFNTKDYNFFAQDDFRATSRLTLNFGLRYELQVLPEPQIANGLVARSSDFPRDRNNFGPRIGFAYALDKDSNTSLRGGYGIYYGRIINSTISNAITNTGVVAGQRQVSLQPNQAGSPTYPNILLAPPTAAGSAGDIIVFSPDMQNPLIHQADIIFERVIAKNTVVSVSGLFSAGRNLPTFVDTNLNTPTATRTYTFSGGPFDGQTTTVPLFTGARPDTRFGRITEIRSTIESQYYGLVLQANRRLTNGLQFQASYTLSKARDNGQTSQTFTSPNVPLNPFNQDGEEAVSTLDIPHRFVASAVYAPGTLFGVGRNSSLGRAIFGGFTIAPIVTIQSGRPYTATISGNATGGTSQGFIGAGGDTRLPNVERNTFRLPYVVNVDLRISRRFRLGETANLEFFAEGFNIFNRVNVTNVGTRAYSISTTSNTTLSYDATAFGIPSEAGNSIFRERQIQFAARLQF